MIDWIIDLDKSLLLWCNHQHTPWLDAFNWIITSLQFNLALILPLIIIFLHRRLGVEAVLLIMAVILTILLCDQIASSVFKPLFERPRPTRDPSLDVITVNGYRGGRFGFISSHAANSFGVAVLLAHLFRNKIFTIVIILWATLVSYSRIYLGVHFPGDVICGALLGLLVGWAMYKLYEAVRRKLYNNRRISTFKNPYKRDGYARLYAVYVVLILVGAGVTASFHL